jgi:hypothetical protein
MTRTPLSMGESWVRVIKDPCRRPETEFARIRKRTECRVVEKATSHRPDGPGLFLAAHHPALENNPRVKKQSRRNRKPAMKNSMNAPVRTLCQSGRSLSFELTISRRKAGDVRRHPARIVSDHRPDIADFQVFNEVADAREEPVLGGPTGQGVLRPGVVGHRRVVQFDAGGQPRPGGQAGDPFEVRRVGVRSRPLPLNGGQLDGVRIERGEPGDQEGLPSPPVNVFRPLLPVSRLDAPLPASKSSPFVFARIKLTACRGSGGCCRC